MNSLLSNEKINEETQIDNNKDNCNQVDSINYTFNCNKCQSKINDLNLLKIHYWKEHISINNILESEEKFKNIQNTVPIKLAKKSKLKTNNLDNDKAKKKQKLNESKTSTDDSIDYSTTINTHNDNDKVDEDKIIKTIENLSDDELLKYNLENINENDLFERTNVLYKNKPFTKSTDFKKGDIGWAQWKYKKETIMWPCVIEKVNKDSGLKVFVNYYEVDKENRKNIFKFPLAKVEPFFRENHFDQKKSGLNVKPFRRDFLICYTDALKDFQNLLDEVEKKSINSNLNESNIENHTTDLSLHSSSKKIAKNKYLVNGKSFTLEQVKEFASKQTSEEQLLVNKTRLEFSNKLLNILITPECEKYLCSIFDETTDCKRHKTYINGDITIRRKMKFCSPGPLIDEDQQKLAGFIIDISKNKYENKPLILTNYEYDVLYPEAVIWGLRKLENLTYKKAEIKYKQGFTRTEEERIKQRCNEILNNLPQMSTNQDETLDQLLNDEDNKTFECASLFNE